MNITWIIKSKNTISHNPDTKLFTCCNYVLNAQINFQRDFWILRHFVSIPFYLVKNKLPTYIIKHEPSFPISLERAKMQKTSYCSCNLSIFQGWPDNIIKMQKRGKLACLCFQSSAQGTIPILRQHIFGLFLTHPPEVSINSTEHQ